MSHVFEFEVTVPFALGGAGVGVASWVPTETFCAVLAEEGAAAEVTKRLRARAFALEEPPVLRWPFLRLVAFTPCGLKVATGPRP